MDNSIQYKKLYALLGTVTPLSFDCGRLCGKACCAVSPDLPGMYLFPGEESLFEGEAGFTSTGGYLPGYGSVTVLACAGTCERDSRPLSCRIFPLAPRVEAGVVSARLDPRGRPVCPLCHQSRGALSAGFLHAVEAVFAELMSQQDTERFLTALSLCVDEYSNPLK